MLQKADLVIWVGEDLESFLPTALKSIPKNSVVLELLDQSGLKKLKFREKNIFEGHDDHGHDDHGDVSMLKKKMTTMTMKTKNMRKKKKGMMNMDTMSMVTRTVNMTHIFG